MELNVFRFGIPLAFENEYDKSGGAGTWARCDVVIDYARKHPDCHIPLFVGYTKSSPTVPRSTSSHQKDVSRYHLQLTKGPLARQMKRYILWNLPSAHVYVPKDSELIWSVWDEIKSSMEWVRTLARLDQRVEGIVSFSRGMEERVAMCVSHHANGDWQVDLVPAKHSLTWFQTEIRERTARMWYGRRIRKEERALQRRLADLRKVADILAS
jgi:hypothetical protein